MEKMTRAAKGFASAATEASMVGAPSLDLETRNLPTVSVGTLTVGVSQVEFKEGVGVRVHIYLMNPAEEAASIPLPNEQTFVLVDTKGHRLQFLSLRLKDVPKGAAAIIVPALERVNITALYNLPADAAPEAILKVGTAGMIRGIPLGEVQVSPPASSSTPSPAPSAQTTPAPDSVARTDSVTRNPSGHHTSGGIR